MSMIFCRTGLMLGLMAGLAGAAAEPAGPSGRDAGNPCHDDGAGNRQPAGRANRRRKSATGCASCCGSIRRRSPAVLRLSPGLLTEPSYLEPYPRSSAFLAEHPDIVQNPAFYLGAARQDWDSDPGATRRAQAAEERMVGFAVFAGLMTLFGVLAWLLKSLIDHQRWKRALSVQADAHTKLLERLSSTEDVVAYAQSPAGRHFLESGGPLDVRAAISAHHSAGFCGQCKWAW